MLRKFFGSIVSAAGAVVGYSLGVKVWNKLTNPVERRKFKKKVVRIKNTIFEKGEES